MDFHPVEQNLRHMFRLLGARRETGDVRELPGITIASLGSSFQMFNAAFLSSPVFSDSDFEQRIASATVQMLSNGLPWAFWMCEDWLPAAMRRRVIRLLERKGLFLASEMPGMTAEFLKPPKRHLPELVIRPASEEPAREWFCRIGSTCFHVPLMWFDEIFDDGALFGGECMGWVGYHDGQAVATSATVTAAGVIGLYNVATLPEVRHRGFGEAMTRHAWDAATARSGLHRTVLQATRQGLGLYRRLGYGSVTRFLVFTSS